MSLQDLADRFQEIDGVKQTQILTDKEVLQVNWKGNPYNYSVQVNNIRNDFPSVTQVEAPDDKAEQDADSMPITYYQED